MKLSDFCLIILREVGGWYQKNSFPEVMFDDLPMKDPGLGKFHQISKY